MQGPKDVLSTTTVHGAIDLGTKVHEAVDLGSTYLGLLIWE